MFFQGWISPPFLLTPRIVQCQNAELSWVKIWSPEDSKRKTMIKDGRLCPGLRLLRCTGPGYRQDFQLFFPRWPDFASAFPPWVFEFSHPFVQGFQVRRWCTQKCLSWRRTAKPTRTRGAQSWCQNQHHNTSQYNKHLNHFTSSDPRRIW